MYEASIIISIDYISGEPSLRAWKLLKFAYFTVWFRICEIKKDCRLF